MDPVRPTTNVSSRQSLRLRPMMRHRTLLIAGLASVAIFSSIRYTAYTMKRNEMAQKERAKLFVPVDRSGGGV